MTPLAPHLTAFFQERLTLERQVSANTCDSYAYAFKLLLDYAGKHLKVAPSRLQFEQIDAPLVVGFLNDLESKRSNAASSCNVRLAAIRSFMRFMEYRVPSALEQIQRVLAIPMKKTDTRLVRHLNTEEIQALLDAPEPTDWSGIRDRAMLHLCFAAGLRVSELTGLRCKTCRCNLTPAFSFTAKDDASVVCRCGSRRSPRCEPGSLYVEWLRYQSSSSTRGANRYLAPVSNIFLRSTLSLRPRVAHRWQPNAYLPMY
jgi:site-specific recombinase XerD